MLPLPDNWKHATKRVARTALRSDQRQIDRYLGGYAVHKLNLGCGTHLMPGWLNADIVPYDGAVMLDASRRLPLPDASFDLIYCEHMIEHMPYVAGKSMLAECYRVLKDDGVIRVATPDVNFLFALYRGERDVERRYVAWAADVFIGDAAPHTALAVINNFVRAWGHCFIYDPATLVDLLRRCGFRHATRVAVGESDMPELRDIENAGRLPPEFYALETLIYDAQKA